jgi:hypothetical protein
MVRLRELCYVQKIQIIEVKNLIQKQSVLFQKIIFNEKKS